MIRVLKPAVVMLLVLFLMTAACAPVAQPDPDPATEPRLEEEEFTVVIALPADVTTLDWHNEPNTTISAARQIFEGLVYVDDDLQLQPGLATSWEIIDDTVWEFKLREGVRFHNGDIFTAKDVKWSLDRIMTESLPSGPQKWYRGWFKDVTVIDDYTVHIHTEFPFPIVDINLARGPIVLPMDYFEEVGPEEFARQPVGTGPYRFVERRVNEAIEMVAYDDHWRGRPPVDRLIWRVIPDESTQIAEVITGGVDLLTFVPAARAQELIDADIPVFSSPAVRDIYVGFNTHEAPFDDVRVRQAVAHALDVQAIIDAILDGHGTRSTSVLTPMTFGWHPELAPIEYDPDKARQLLAEAGYPDGFQTTLEAGPGQWPATVEATEAVAGYLQEVGIQADISIYEFGEYFTRYRESQLLGLHLWGNGLTLDADAHVSVNWFCPPTGRGLYFCSEETDALILEARFELDRERREQLYWQLLEIFREQMTTVPLWNYSELAAVSPRIEWTPRGDTYIDALTIRPAGQ